MKPAWKNNGTRSCQKLSWTTEQFRFSTADFAHICYNGISSPHFWYQCLCVHLHMQAERKQDWGRFKYSVQGCLPPPAQGGVLRQSLQSVTWSGQTQTAALPHKTQNQPLGSCVPALWLCWWGFTVHVSFKPIFQRTVEKSLERDNGLR